MSLSCSHDQFDTIESLQRSLIPQTSNWSGPILSHYLHQSDSSLTRFGAKNRIDWGTFIEEFCVKFEFNSAQKKLRECEAVLSTKFLLVSKTSLRTLDSLRFSGLPIMIWEKNLQRIFAFGSPILKSNAKNLWKHCVKKVNQVIWQIFQKKQFKKSVSKAFKSIWRANTCMDPVQKNSIISVLLFFAVFTVNGLH